MPRPAPASKARCPEKLHRRSLVRAWGTYAIASGTFRRYRCDPLIGDHHFFSVPLEIGRKSRGHRHAPECPNYPGSGVIRYGTCARWIGDKPQSDG